MKIIKGGAVIDVFVSGNKTKADKKVFLRRIDHTQRQKTTQFVIVKMMTTSRPERFVILSLGKTMPGILLQTTVCHHDDDHVDSDDDDSGDSDDFEIRF